MSSDLLKEFGDEGPINRTESSTTKPLDDDWGDFEEADGDVDVVNGSPGEAPASLPTLDNVQHNNPLEAHATPNPSAGDDWGAYEHGDVFFDAEAERSTIDEARQQSAMAKINSTSTDQVHVSLDDSFEDWEPQEALPSAVMPRSMEPHAKVSQATQMAPTGNVSTTTTPDLGTPPTNVPPPSILLSLGPLIVQETHETVRKPMNRARDDVIEIICEQISQLRAMARILAGRKQRWKRDKFLAQSTKIGPAGRQGGMKLSGVDKGESKREEQAVSEVVTLWKRLNGPIRNGMVKMKDLLATRSVTLPNLSEIMPTRSVGPDEGGIKSLHTCFLCGLNREERVSNVDSNVQDSFGEWWIEHWGHIDCVHLWRSREKDLAQR